jgi:hypothetical protein
MLALMQSGIPPEDEMIQRGLKYLRGLPPDQTYTVGLQTMVFCLAAQPQDAERIKANVKWLERSMVKQQNIAGWSYTADGALPDNSNTNMHCWVFMKRLSLVIRSAPINSAPFASTFCNRNNAMAVGPTAVAGSPP